MAPEGTPIDVDFMVLFEIFVDTDLYLLLWLYYFHFFFIVVFSHYA